MILAVRLWRRPLAEAIGPHVTARQVYVTTMLNPKALVFGLVLLPAPTDADFPVRLARFCLMVAAVALAWGGGGAATRASGGSPGRLVALRRLASAWLAVVSLSLMASVVWR